MSGQNPRSSRGGFDVVLTGDIEPGFTPVDVAARLSRAFGIDIHRAGQLLRQSNKVVKRNAGHDEALRYASALEAAGVLFRLVSHDDGDEGERGVAASSSPSVLASPSTLAPSVLPVIQIGLADVRRAPIKCARLYGSPRGDGFIVSGPFGQEHYRFDQVHLLAIYRLTFEQQNRVEILVFVDGKSRPYVVEVGAIQFVDFSEIRAGNQLSSLRNFGLYVERFATALVMDRGTRFFLNGSPLAEVDKDPIRISTALYEAFEQWRRS